MSVDRVRPYFVEDVLNILLSVAQSAGADVHPEFIRALVAVARAFGISSDELRGGKLLKKG